MYIPSDVYQKKTFTNNKGILLMVFHEQRKWGQGRNHKEAKQRPVTLIL